MATHAVEADTSRELGLANESGYRCWLRYAPTHGDRLRMRYLAQCGSVTLPSECSPTVEAAAEELSIGIEGMLGTSPEFVPRDGGIVLQRVADATAAPAGSYSITARRAGPGDVGPYADHDIPRFRVTVSASDDIGLLYGTFHLLRLMQTGAALEDLDVSETPGCEFRMLDHWDNVDGSVERGYAGGSIFFSDGAIREDLSRVADYARLLASVGINAVSINNVNVRGEAARLVTSRHLSDVARIADVFRPYGIRLFLSTDYSSPISLGGLPTADPAESSVREFWQYLTRGIYEAIPDFGGYVVKADSENRPGPFTYGRNHAEGANVIAHALGPYGGTVVWRCFVYDCHQDWRDRDTDRARAAFDTFKPLDGDFMGNVALQVKNGPVDFQVREPVSPLLGGLERTGTFLELQITQEYTGQQRHLCYLVPQWKEILEFDTHAEGPGSTVGRLVSGDTFPLPRAGTVGVANVGDEENWTGHHLAQANLYGFGRLAWDPELPAAGITDEWVRLTFGNDPEVCSVVSRILLDSWPTYERYTAPLGIGWMCNPGHHYGPNPDGYEYSEWGTYHFADHTGIGVDRTLATGTGYSAQYHPAVAAVYESIDSCPDELLLFFHHVDYAHVLKSGKTVLQHIYDSHFQGVVEVEAMRERWCGLRGKIDLRRFDEVLSRLDEQVEHATLWRDVINTYFLRKTMVGDEGGRHIYP